jgi:hypothetical protein
MLCYLCAAMVVSYIFKGFVPREEADYFQIMTNTFSGLIQPFKVQILYAIRRKIQFKNQLQIFFS